MYKAQQAMLVRALDIAKDYNVALDFSMHSVVNVNNILMRMHGEFVNDREKEAHVYAVMGFAISFGAYIIEVIERKYGIGEWNFDTTQIGERASYPYVHSGLLIYPVDWCADAIAIGQGENVLYKYKAFTAQIDLPKISLDSQDANNLNQTRFSGGNGEIRNTKP